MDDQKPRPRRASEELRASSDAMLQTIETLKDIEQLKRQATIGSPEFRELVARAESLARDVFRWSIIQSTVAVAAEDEDGQDSHRSIEDTPSRPMARVLADWRQAHLRLDAAKPGSPEADAATDAIERYREEYMLLETQARAGTTPGKAAAPYAPD